MMNAAIDSKKSPRERLVHKQPKTPSNVLSSSPVDVRKIGKSIQIRNFPSYRPSPTAAQGSCRIRSRFLNTLGIHTLNANSESEWQKRLSRDINILKATETFEAIKLAGNDNDSFSVASTSSLSLYSWSSADSLEVSSFEKVVISKASVSFSESVTIHYIPMRNEYSPDVQKQLWSHRLQARQHSRRNAVEFEAESWNWRHALEEKDMFMCSETGELVHPVHYVSIRPYNLQRQFFNLMSAQQGT